MDKNQKFVITIAREVGSGGRTIGRKLAEKLNIRYCDKDLIEGLVDQFGLSVYEIETIKARKKSWLTDFIERVAPVPGPGAFVGFNPRYGEDLNHNVTSEDLFKAETEIIRGLAEEGSCVIAGRSGFFVLRDHPNHLRVFIEASKDYRVARVAKRQNLTEEQAEIIVETLDRDRENYVRRFANVSRSNTGNYDLVLNVDHLTEDAAVECILKYMEVSR